MFDLTSSTRKATDLTSQFGTIVLETLNVKGSSVSSQLRIETSGI
jgi:hypothetical protein